jgi:hypothetical protein
MFKRKSAHRIESRELRFAEVIAHTLVVLARRVEGVEQGFLNGMGVVTCGISRLLQEGADKCLSRRVRSARA